MFMRLASPPTKRSSASPKASTSPSVSGQAAARREGAAVDAGALVAAEVFQEVGGGVRGDDAGVLGGDGGVGQDDVAGDGAANQRFGGQDVGFAVRGRQAGRGGAARSGTGDAGASAARRVGLLEDQFRCRRW